MRLTIILLMAILACSCQNNATSDQEDQTTKVDLAKALPGGWETTYIRVQVNSYLNADSSFVFEIKEENWEERMQIAPLRTYFQSDNKYRREHRTLDGNLMDATRGVWNTFGDTLMLIEPDATYSYQVKLGNGLGEFSAELDWDGDGEADDQYLDIKRYIGISTQE